MSCEFDWNCIVFKFLKWANENSPICLTLEGIIFSIEDEAKEYRPMYCICESSVKIIDLRFFE